MSAVAVPLTVAVGRRRHLRWQTRDEARERRAAYDRRRYLENREAVIARTAAWDAAHPESNRLRCRAYRRRKNGREVAS